MKICFIIPQVMKAVSGGLCTQVTSLADSLKKKGVTIVYFNPWESCDWSDITLTHIFRADLETYNIAQWLYDAKHPFVVTPVFFNQHNHLSLRISSTMFDIARKIHSGVRTDLDCVHDICRYSLKVLPNTYEEKKFLEKGLSISSLKTKVIPNGVEERFAQADPSLFTEKYGIKDFILSVANFEYKRKNMLHFIRALEKINHPAVLIGTLHNNDYGRECKKRIEKNSNILWLDSIPHTDPLLASAYAACKVFALPSYYETPGLAALEAALAGANIVITPFGGPKEYFGNMAEYINPDDITSIQNAIVTALEKPPNRDLKLHILAHYTYPVITDQLIGIYEEIGNTRQF